MDLKRILTSIIGFPLVILVIILGNEQIISFAITIVAIICMYEYLKVISKICKPIKWIAYLSTVLIFLISILSEQILKIVLMFSIPTILLILFLHIILSDMKITFKDVVYTFFGVCYISGFISFLSAITMLYNGKYLLAYTILVAWGTDVFAYTSGKYFGKHHFSKVSPKKTIEGCIVGAVAAVLVGIIYAMFLNKGMIFKIDNYLYVGFFTFILSIISQIGDFAASSIKRFADCKDYGSLLPGHGGMLDRIDSLIFIAPFAYMFFSILI